MKSFERITCSGGESQLAFQKLFASVQPDIEKSNRISDEFFASKQSEAKNLIFSDSKVHMKKISESDFQLLEYGGYADSRPNNNRDSLDNNSQQLVVLVN